MNLLHETKEMITGCEHTPDDIIFIGSIRTGHQCTWEEFVILADREYDASYGTTEVATDLQINFCNGDRLFRYSYDGSECWMLMEAFNSPPQRKPIHSLFGEDDTLEAINR